MEQFEEQLEKKLEFLDKNKSTKKGIKHTTISKKNADLIREFIEKNRDLSKPPCAHRLLMQVCRLKSISLMLGDKPLDEINLEDIKKLNRAMTNKKMRSAGCYRKTLRRFLRLKDKKKFADLLDEEYFKESGDDRPLVEPEKFWSNEELERYLQHSKQHSLRQAAFAAIWISSGARPAEILGLRKKAVFMQNENTLVIRINGTKTKFSKRSVVIKGSSAKANWDYIKPYLDTLTDEQLLFEYGWCGARKIHRQICFCARIPKTKYWNFYGMRKQALTRLYRDKKLGTADACAMAGHRQFSGSIANYVGVTEQSLIDDAPYEIALKHCPNPLCRFDNEPHVLHCVKCDAPLDIEKYAKIVKQEKELVASQVEELVQAKLDSVLAQFALKVKDSKGNSIRLCNEKKD